MSTFIPGSFAAVYRAISTTPFRNLCRSAAPPYHRRRQIRVLPFQFQHRHNVESKMMKELLISSGGTCKHAPSPPPSQQDANPDRKDLNHAAVMTAKSGRASVVKLHCAHTSPSFLLPWQMKKQSSSISSGFMIEGRRVLTSAHCVKHQTHVRLMKRGSRVKYSATVLAVGTNCDLGENVVV